MQYYTGKVRDAIKKKSTCAIVQSWDDYLKQLKSKRASKESRTKNENSKTIFSQIQSFLQVLEKREKDHIKINSKKCSSPGNGRICSTEKCSIFT
mmetsp:Transcript_23944/g.24409  ORF Transcript_23944/g.24409 Transcript_23944/m.24409 type:complete len:95 (-) Transcript_23944:71-355(-)